MAWSLTKVKTLQDCGAKYDYKYNQKIKELPNAFAGRGLDVHAALEGFIRSGTPLTGKLEFYHGFLTQLKEHPVPIMPELRIALRSDWSACPDGENPWLVMVLDLFRKVEVSAHLWDWKTGKVYDDHVDQRELYAAGVFAAHPEVEVVTATHVYVDLGKNKEQVFSREFDFERLKEKWGAKAAKLDNLGPQDLIPNPTFRCRWCSYSRIAHGPERPCPF